MSNFILLPGHNMKSDTNNTGPVSSHLSSSQLHISSQTELNYDAQTVWK